MFLREQQNFNLIKSWFIQFFDNLIDFLDKLRFYFIINQVIDKNLECGENPRAKDDIKRLKDS